MPSKCRKCKTVCSPFTGIDLKICVSGAGVTGAPRSASRMTRPLCDPDAFLSKPRISISVGVMSALLTGACATYDALKSGPEAIIVL